MANPTVHTKCPFPGMDPYIERPVIWPDFHDSLIAYIRELLQPALRPRYAALTQDRLVVVEHDRPIAPDVSVIDTSFGDTGGGTAVAVEPEVAVIDEPLVITMDEFREPYIHIVEPAAGNRVVTAIEVLSPENKRGSGLRQYRKKQEELLDSGTNLVEIDLLRSGTRVLPDCEPLTEQISSPWLVLVSRRLPLQYEAYRIELESRLPRVKVPLADDDDDVVLDLPAAFERCWNAGPYPMLLNYDEEPPGSMTPQQVSWCRQRIAEPAK